MPQPSNLLWDIWLGVACLYGICIGSFLNVVIYRLPLGQSVAEPVWSYCPNCKHRLAGLDLIPLASFLALGRRCRYCHTPISWRYFGVELLTGVLFGAVYLHDGPSVLCIFDCCLVALLVPIFFIDLEQFIIPNELSALGIGLGVARNLWAICGDAAPGQLMRVFGTHWQVWGSIGAAVVCALLFHLISFAGLLFYADPKRRSLRLAGEFWIGVLDDWAYVGVKSLGFGLWLAPARRYIAEHEREWGSEGESEADGELDTSERGVEAHGPVAMPTQTLEQKREAHGASNLTHAEIAAEIEADEQQTGMGQGDAKLAAVIGAYLLMPLSLVAFFMAVLAGTVVGVGLMAARGRGGHMAIPFGPFLVCGMLLSLLFGQQVIAWYLSYAGGMAAAAR